jgi:hypothetical protein
MYIRGGLMLFELTKNNIPKFIFLPFAQENFIAPQGHDAKLGIKSIYDM